MDPFKDTLAYWSSVIGTAVEVLGIVEQAPWLAGLGLVLIAASIAAFTFGWKARQRLRLAAVTIEGRRIDSLNLASLERRLNRTLLIQEADQVATIKGEDLVVTWRYSGYCRAASEASVEFSIDMDNHVPFERLDCVAYDLRNDPGRTHAIRPVLLGSDGLSKKVAVPLLKRLSAQDPFSVLLRCSLPGCIKSGVEYYASSTSVSQPAIPEYTVRLLFVGDRPEWLRAYECDSNGKTALIKDLRPSHEDRRMTEYLDLASEVAGQSARIYLFRRGGYS